MSKKSIRIDFKEKKQRFSLTLLLAGVVFIILLSAIVLAAIVAYLLSKLGVISGLTTEMRLGQMLVFMPLSSLIIASAFVVLLGKIPLRPINKLVNGLNGLAAGNFKTRIEYGGPIGNHPTFKEITGSFNKLAEELENTEVMRSDFVNNFSHEFKTPIVSIAGLAKVLKKGDLSEEQATQYLDAIEEESMRLAAMATNILNLGKVENQAILTDITEFNLSEQLRACILLFESKWERKNVELNIDFDEYFIEANEELLKEVWINLIDNALKFVPRCGMLSVSVAEQNGVIAVTVANTGSEIPNDKLDKIWNKFYQADESHATEGNGIGLAIVKRIVELHGGAINVESASGVTAFTVELPQKR